jgi:urea transport system permease protein
MTTRRRYTLWITARRDPGSRWFLGGLMLVSVAVPLLNLVVPSSSSYHLTSYGLALIGKYLCYALLALAVDLIWGYCGILSLGHAAFFALGGYAMGMYGNPILPDFMVFLNWKSCPGSGTASTISGSPSS